MNTRSFSEKQQRIIDQFKNAQSKEDIYQKIIDIGKQQQPLADAVKTAERLVPGCQSRMYLLTRFEDGLLYFQTESDALISAGLGMLVTEVYSGETPEVILTSSPSYLDKIGIRESITPGRAHGLASLFLKIKQEALRHIS